MEKIPAQVNKDSFARAAPFRFFYEKKRNKLPELFCIIICMALSK
jgi:hypothetical protein